MQSEASPSALPGVTIQKTNRVASIMKILLSGEANLMEAFSQMQGSTTNNPDFIGYQ